MTTRQATPTIDRLLRKARGGRYQTEVADEIGVSRNSYRMWESGHHVPEDEWVRPLTVYLGRDEEDVVWVLYQSRLAKNRVSILPNNPILAVAA